MLLLALASRRAQRASAEITRFVLQAEIHRAIQSGFTSLDRRPGDAPLSPEDHAHIGHLLGRCLLACGREEEAEELCRQMLKVYERVSRPHVRWGAALDQAAMAMHFNRPGRAAENFCTLADDASAPADLRIEAMAGAALALHRSGDCRNAWHSLDVARRLADETGDNLALRLIDCIGLEMSVIQRKRSSEGLDDHALCAVYREPSREPVPHDLLCQQLQAAAGAFALGSPLVSQRMAHLSRLAAPHGAHPASAGLFLEGIDWLRRRKLVAYESEWRAESTLALIERGAMQAAADLLAVHGIDKQQARRSRHRIEMEYCLARIYTYQGRHVEALQLYKQHSQEAVLLLRNEAGRRHCTSFLDSQRDTKSGVDAMSLRLPLRYRRAYQYIVENLHDANLSVHQVAVHLGVTARALQMAFRAHLGMTPAELIRTRRMERIREELCADGGAHGVLELATRWGIKSRSTLVSNYRSRFSETPTETLQGESGE